MMASRRSYVFTRCKIVSKKRRNKPNTMRFSWLRAARGKTKVEKAEKSVRMTMIKPATKTRTLTRVSESNMDRIIKQDVLFAFCNNRAPLGNAILNEL